MCNKSDAKYRMGTFTDSRGGVYHLTVCAVKDDLDEGQFVIADGTFHPLATEFEDTTIRNAVYVGYSVCRPSEAYDPDLEKQMAYDNALDDDLPTMALYTAYPQMISENVVQALVESEYNRIACNPAWVIEDFNKSVGKGCHNYDSLTDKQKRLIDLLLDCDAEEIIGLLDMTFRRRMHENAPKKRRGRPKKNE